MKALVIEATGLPVSYLGCYGNDWIDTPNFDVLAAAGVVFDQHYADSLDAQPSSPWTGRIVLPVEDEESPPPGPDLLTAALAGANVELHRLGKVTRFGSVPVDALAELDATIAEGQKQLRRLKKQDNWLLWLTLPSLAPPWHLEEEALESYFADEPVEEGGEPLTPWLNPPWDVIDSKDNVVRLRLQNTFAGVVARVDQAIGRLLDGIADDVLIVVSASRGLHLGEHSMVGECRPWLHEELIHLPLILRLPGGADAGRRVHGLTQAVDLLPTFLSAFGQSIPADTHGHDLLPLARGQADEVRPCACIGLRQGERLEYALRTPELGLILPARQAFDDPVRPAQLYGKPDDRHEVNDVRARQSDVMEALEQTLRAAVTALRQPGPPTLPALPEL